MNNCKSKCSSLSICAFLFILNSVFSAFSQEIGDTLWVPVTYYDFHSNKSNPEFEQNIYTGVRENMVQDTLDSERKPIVNQFNDNVNRNAYIKYWFRPWEDMAKGDSTYPTYDDNGDGVWGRYIGVGDRNHDTSFINMVFEDSLPFIYIDGRYQYNNQNFFPLDGKGFGAENSGYRNNFSFTMELHWEFEMKDGLVFDFRGDDDVWAFIDNRLVMDLGGRHGPEEGSFELDDFEHPDGSKLVSGQKYMLDFFFAERHTSGSTITITTNVINIKPQKVSLTAEPNDTVAVYEPIDLSGLVIDDTGGTIDTLSSKIRWRFVDDGGNPEDALKDYKDGNAQLIPEIPETWVWVEGFIPLENGDTLFDTLKIWVTKGSPYKVWIEAVGLDTTTEDYLRNPKRLGDITIGASQNTAEVYAVVRDRTGYYLRKADPEWESRNESLITVEGKNDKEYHGIITRVGPNDTAHVVAKEGSRLEYDSVKVHVVNYYIDSLILVRHGTFTPVTSIEMETDSSDKYDVYGTPSTLTDDEKDDPSNWVKTNVKWVIDNDDLKFEYDLPSLASLWECSPKAPGEGTLTLSIPNESRTPKLDIPVKFLRSKASDAEIILISGESELIAGNILRAEVIIKNKDGRVPGSYCFGSGDEEDSVVYYDTLSRGGKNRPRPEITVDNVNTYLNTESSKTIKHAQCFNDGVDTIEFVLYYAPFNYKDSLHQITVVLNSKLKAKTKPFRLRTGTIQEIEITDNKRKEIDSINLTVDESMYTYITGYDEYGNETFPVIGNWSSKGNIPDITGNATTAFIDATGITRDATGNICATLNDTISDCVPVTMHGPGATLTSAITRDKNGNGYLDCIELYFNYPVNVSDLEKSSFKIIRGSTNEWQVKDEITSIKGDSTAFAINLLELDNKMPQTSWRLKVSVDGHGSINNIKELATTDGAPPVVWKVEKKSILPGDRTKDEVTIILTESILGANGSKFDIFIAPEDVFHIYVREANGKFTSTPLFDDIEHFQSIGDALSMKSNQLKIIMSNGFDITPNNWVNINHVNKLLMDSTRNMPDEKNQKVQVDVKGDGTKVVAGPNPATGGFHFDKTPDISMKHNPEAIKWAKHVGVAFDITLILPNPGDKIAAYLKIYDAVGNMVNHSSTKDLLKNLEQGSSSMVQVLLYWNGSTKKGMIVSPGIYKYVINFEYRGKGKYSKQEPCIGLIGIAKGTSNRSSR